jgi:hypothetical protein
MGRPVRVSQFIQKINIKVLPLSIKDLKDLSEGKGEETKIF